ncbi:zinc finger protein 578 [Parambassis ranga]|uniref:Zinc finger protein 578 n=1 Tax=Parambassis ranga TaxID=210632 RepID=A0A6P7HL11_9TELE|nr:zinc finger protein 578-like [Parambassis ranga]
MSDLDTLIVTFQTQLSDVMETVVKTAMFEVTKLVEDVLLVEVKRRNEEVETLRLQLQWTERKFSDQAAKEEEVKTGRCVHCARDGVELSADSAEERCKDQQDDMMRGCNVKTESDSGERWMASCRQEVISESPQEAADPTVSQSPEREPPETEEEDMIAAVDMKEEEVNKPSCLAVRVGGWSGDHDGDAAPESDSEMVEAQPKQPQENCEKLLRNVIKQDPQISAAYAFPKDQQESHMASEPPHTSSFEMDNTTWAGLTVTTAALLQNQNPTKSKSSVKATDELSNSVRADVQVTPGRDQISSSGTPKARHSEALGVTIKEEVIIDSDGESAHMEKKNKPGIASLLCSVKQHKVSSGAHKLNHISHKATVQEVMKLHSKVGTGLRLQAAIQHLHRPMKKAPHTLSNSTAAALSLAHSQVINLNNLNRIPSTSKAAAPPLLSVQRLHLSDKQTSPLNRAGAPWVSIKSQHQSVNSHHANPALHPDSQVQAGPRHLLRCSQCGKCFPHPSNLKAHLQTHTGERPFCCSLCGRSFTKLSNLKAHRRVHTGERPYCCLACGKRFTQKCNLKRHQRIHLDV